MALALLTHEGGQHSSWEVIMSMWLAESSCYNYPMSDSIANTPPEFEGLSTEERIRRVQELWDFIAQSPEEATILDSHKRILDARLAEFDREGDLGTPWPEVRERLLRQLRRD